MSVSSAVNTRYIQFEDDTYPFHFGYNCLPELTCRIAVLKPDRMLLVTDSRVAGLFGEELTECLMRIAPTMVVKIEPGEQHKAISVLASLAERAVEGGLTRRSVVVACGGGVAGNLAGLLAALLFRGLRLVQIPTTIVAMFDSVISLKQAVNLPQGKNLLGTYHAPSMVLADLALLRSLPARDVRSGMCEIIKNALAIEPKGIEFLFDHLDVNCCYTDATLLALLEFSIAAKLKVVTDDRRERRRGLILEYGHTVGHAVELADSERSATGGLSHGEAVAVGMMAAAHIAHQQNLLASAAVDIHRSLLERGGISCTLPPGLSTDRVMELVRYDNKRGYLAGHSGYQDMILLRDLGVPNGPPELPLTPVPLALVESAVRELCPAKVRVLAAG